MLKFQLLKFMLSCQMYTSFHFRRIHYWVLIFILSVEYIPYWSDIILPIVAYIAYTLCAHSNVNFNYNKILMSTYTLSLRSHASSFLTAAVLNNSIYTHTVRVSDSEAIDFSLYPRLYWNRYLQFNLHYFYLLCFNVSICATKAIH